MNILAFPVLVEGYYAASKQELAIADYEQQYNAHAELMGHVTLAWSSVHSTVFAIFLQLSGMEKAKAEAGRLRDRQDLRSSALREPNQLKGLSPLPLSS